MSAHHLPKLVEEPAAGYAAIASAIALDLESGRTTPTTNVLFAIGVMSLVATVVSAVFALRRSNLA